MKKIKPYLIFAVTMFGLLAAYKMFVQPIVASNATAAKVLPTNL